MFKTLYTGSPQITTVWRQDTKQKKCIHVDKRERGRPTIPFMLHSNIDQNVLAILHVTQEYRLLYSPSTQLLFDIQFEQFHLYLKCKCFLFIWNGKPAECRLY